MKISKYYAMRFSSWLCDYLVLFAIPVLAYSVTFDVRWSGAAIFFQWGPRLFGLSIASLKVDALPPRLILIGADSARVATAVLAGALMIAFPNVVLPTLMVFAMIVGLCFELTFVAGEKLGQSLVPAAEQERFQSELTAFEQVGMVLGPALAGVALSFPPYILMFCAAILFGISFLMSLSVPGGKISVRLGEKRSLRRTLRVVFADPTLKRIIFVTMGLNFILALINGAAPAITLQMFGMTSRELGFVYAGSSVLSIVGLMAFHRLTQRVPLSKLGIWIAVGMGLSAGGIAVAYNQWIFAIFLGIFLLLDAFFSVYMRVARARRVPPENYAATVGFFCMLIIAPMPLAGLTLATVGKMVDARVLIAVSAGIVLVSAVCALPRDREFATYEAAPTPEKSHV